jgi:hypothetical protein
LSATVPCRYILMGPFFAKQSGLGQFKTESPV